MTRFEDDRFYRPDDKALRNIATQGTLAQWRFRGAGPAFHRLGRRVLYLGADLNRWVDQHRVEPRAA